MSFFRRANRFYKKLFTPYRFPIDSVIQAKDIRIDQSVYTLVGQQSIKDVPWITNFVVYDETGHLVDASTAKEIYVLVTMASFIETLQPLQGMFRKQRQITKDSQIKDTYGIGLVSTDIVAAWENVRQTATSLKKKHTWTKEECVEFRHTFTKFWKLYEERASLLMLLPSKQQKQSNKKVDNLIASEAQLLASLFVIRRLEIEIDPLDLEIWLASKAKQSLANERTAIISTPADKQSHRILTWCFYIVILGLITPFFLYRTYVDGFAHLFFMFVFYAIFVALYVTNRHRLKTSIHLRLAELWRTAGHEENKPLLHARATSVNMAASVHYITIAAIGMLGLQLYREGWDGVAQFFLLLLITSIAFSIWFPYSPFVEKLLTFYPHQVRAGHRIFPVSDMHQVSFDKQYICYNFYLTYTNEPYEVYIEKTDREAVQTFMEEWCASNELTLKPFDKKDRGKFK